MSIGKEIGRGVLFNLLSKYSNVVIQIILMIVLSRLLTPEIFGEIAIILTFLVFFNYFGNIGIGAAIVQKKDLNKEEINQAFNFTILLGIGLVILYLFSTNIIGTFYKSEIFENTKFLVGTIIFFSALNTVPNSILRRDKKFKEMSINEIIANIISAIVSISMAYMKFGLYAVIFQNLSRVVLLTVFNVFSSRILKIFKGTLNFEFLRKIYGYSFFEFMTNIFNYFSRSADNILIAKYMDLSVLGYYDRAYRLILFPIKNFTQLLTPVLHPILSEYQDDREKMYGTFVKTSKLMMFLSAPISVFLYFNSENIIKIVYGENWLVSAKYFRILSISLIPQMLNGIFQAFYLSTGNTKKLFFNNLLSNGLLVGGIIVGIYFKNLELVVYNISLGYLFKFIIDVYILVKKIFRYRLLKYLLEIKNLIVVIFFLVLSQILVFEKTTNAWISLGTKSLSLICFYAVALFLTKEIYNLKIKRRKNARNFSK